MSLLKNPNEIEDNSRLCGLIYGQPGVGKTTLLLSGPTPVLIDADRGMHRVSKRFQVPSLPLNRYADFLALLDGNELDPFESICIDTLGRFLDRMSDFLIETNPKLRQADGSLTLKGYGSMRIEFQRVLRKVKDKEKYLFFGAHEKEEKENDGRYMRPDSAGSAGKDLVKDLDFLGYMEMNGTRHTISFSPTDKYYAKNSLGLEAVIEVPDPEKVGNTFLQKHIIESAAIMRKKAAEMNKEYDDLIALLDAHVATATTPETFDLALKAIQEAPVIWDSQRVAKHKLADKSKDAGIAYDKAEKRFKGKGPAVEPEVAAAQAAKAETKAAPPPAAPPVAEPAQPVTLDVLADSLMNGVKDCKTVAELEAYLLAQVHDFVEITGKAPLGLQIRVQDSVKAKRAEFAKAA